MNDEVEKKYPPENSTFVDKKDMNRTLWVREVIPGAKNGREILGQISHPGDDLQHNRPYSTDQRTFWNVWKPSI